MNWLEKMSLGMPMSQAPGPDLMLILNDVLNVTGGDINYAEQEFSKVAPVPEEVCAKIQEIGESPQWAQHRGSMERLAHAGNCPWPPQPQQNVNPNPNMMDPAAMPMMGQQEQPAAMPSAEIG